LQMGWTDGIIMQDVPICYPDPIVDPTTKKPIQDETATACKGWYVPHNYDDLKFSGRFPLRYAWGNSLNIAATEGLAFAGWNPAHSQNFISMAQRLGITSLTAGNMGPTTALGTQDISLMQLTGAYAVFADGGKRVPPRAILRIEDNTGNQIYPVPPGPSIAPPEPGQQVISPETAYMVTSVLTDNIARAQDFGYANNPLHFTPPTVDGTNYPNFELAAKTGTSSGVNTGPRDIVTAGYSNYLSLGVWIGNANSAGMASGIIGIAGAGYVFHDVMLYGIQHLGWNTNSHFPIPSDMGRTYFNCTTGLAPYKDTKIGDMTDPTFNCPFQPYTSWASKNYSNLYDHDTPSEIKAQPDMDWYIKTQPWLQS
ncbi:MAG: penicillin-binding transpeptidase domain-containing protein, partial [Ktedonobacterales bacterium]